MYSHSTRRRLPACLRPLLPSQYKWEQTSKYGESEVIVRFPLAAPATKRDVKVSGTWDGTSYLALLTYHGTPCHGDTLNGVIY